MKIWKKALAAAGLLAVLLGVSPQAAEKAEAAPLAVVAEALDGGGELQPIDFWSELRDDIFGLDDRRHHHHHRRHYHRPPPPPRHMRRPPPPRFAPPPRHHNPPRHHGPGRPPRR